ncbi:hypothetical protein BJ965_001962 [Streptomyces luteogriseus]|uniref:Uncharacterized protein n=1 Tax=Streptomyces luteogriseus TaxID=68233 RepID=A0A7W7DLR4_9ACTN|nr:hypothetical protein [Streptomyces luteogriseus]
MATLADSKVSSSFQAGVPGTPDMVVPRCAEACQMPNTAPEGSEPIARRPASAASSGPTPIVPPRLRTVPAVRSTSSEAKYGVHAMGRWRSGGSRPMPATSRPSSRARTYGPSCWGPGWNSQPNSAP